jgi:ribosomal protein S18 acetylase RimI-like enzyme
MASQLILESFQEFYRLFSESTPQILRSIREQLCAEETELCGARLLMMDEAVVGCYCAYDSREMERRQMASLRVLLELEDRKDDVMSQLRSYRRQVEPVRVPGFYLSRIGVVAELRGTGLGQILLDDFEFQAKARGMATVCLHVEHGNARARRFYSKAGYLLVSNPGLGYHTMQKDLSRQ